MTSQDRKDVFLNVPFDVAYEPLFIALVGTLVFLGRRPHCVLEIPETGDGRLARILELMRECPVSIHDLSRVGTPVRFNMPFELGLACGLRLARPVDYEVLVFDAKPFRIDRTLSDYKGRDPLIHRNRAAGMVTCLLDAFEATSAVPVAQVRKEVGTLQDSAEILKREYMVATVFTPSLFRAVVGAATNIGMQSGLITPR
jgi:hypothetical protein